MAKIKEYNHMGNMVLFLYPTPNTRKLPSVLYKKAGFMYWVTP